MIIKKSSPLIGEDLKNVDQDPINKTDLHPLEVGVYYYKLHEKNQPGLWEETLVFRVHSTQSFRSDNARWRVMTYMDERYSDIPKDLAKDSTYEEAMKYPEVQIIADEIKGFYLSRFTEKKLANVEDFNSFQSTLYEYLSRPNLGHFFSNEIGLVSTLPHSYQSDMEFLRVAKECNTGFNDIKRFAESNNQYNINPDDKRINGINNPVTILGAYLAPSAKPKWKTALLCRDEKIGVMLNIYIERSSYHDLAIDLFKKTPKIYIQAHHGFIIRRDGNYCVNVFDSNLRLL